MLQEGYFSAPVLHLVFSVYPCIFSEANGQVLVGGWRFSLWLGLLSRLIYHASPCVAITSLLEVYLGDSDTFMADTFSSCHSTRNKN